MKVFLRLCLVAGLIRVSSGVDDCTDDTILLQLQSNLKDVKGLAHVKDNDLLEQTQATQSTPSIEQEPEDDLPEDDENLIEDSWDSKAVATDLAHNSHKLERLLATSVETTMDEVFEELTQAFDVEATATAFNKLLDVMNKAAEFASKVADEASELKNMMDSSENAENAETAELLQNHRRRWYSSQYYGGSSSSYHRRRRGGGYSFRRRYR